MSTGKVILVVASTMVIFAAGVITGGVLVKKTSRPAASAGVPFLGRVEAIHRAAQQIDLSPEQRERITGIVRESREQIADYFVILEPDIQQVFRKMREQIRAELSPEQRRQFEEFLRRRQGRMDRTGGDGMTPRHGELATTNAVPGR